MKWHYNDRDQQVMLPFCLEYEILFQMRPDRQAAREAAGAALSAVEASFEAELPTQHSVVCQTTRKRSASTSNHPWPFKKDKSKNVKPEFHPIHPGIICNRCYFVVSLNRKLFEMFEVAFAQI